MQDVIGDHQDAVSPSRCAHWRSGGRAQTALAAGRLIERQRQRKRATRKAYTAAWRRLEKVGKKTFS